MILSPGHCEQKLPRSVTTDMDKSIHNKIGASGFVAIEEIIHRLIGEGANLGDPIGIKCHSVSGDI